MDTLLKRPRHFWLERIPVVVPFWFGLVAGRKDEANNFLHAHSLNRFPTYVEMEDTTFHEKRSDHAGS